MKKKLSQFDLDARFAEMANDPDYQSAALSLAREFEPSDWAAFRSTEIASEAYEED
jgi:hypothetical protein